MYAIFDDGGKQYKVSSGDFLLVERRDLDENVQEVSFDKVLMVGEGGNAQVGTPWIEGATVTAKVVDELKMPKVTGVKMRRRKGYVKRWGHRQRMLKVQIADIKA